MRRASVVLPVPGRAPEDDRLQQVALDGFAQRAARRDELLLSLHLVERARAHPLGERHRFRVGGARRLVEERCQLAIRADDSSVLAAGGALRRRARPWPRPHSATPRRRPSGSRRCRSARSNKRRRQPFAFAADEERGVMRKSASCIAVPPRGTAAASDRPALPQGRRTLARHPARARPAAGRCCPSPRAALSSPRDRPTRRRTPRRWRRPLRRRERPLRRCRDPADRRPRPPATGRGDSVSTSDRRPLVHERHDSRRRAHGRDRVHHLRRHRQTTRALRLEVTDEPGGGRGRADRRRSPRSRTRATARCASPSRCQPSTSATVPLSRAAALKRLTMGCCRLVMSGTGRGRSPSLQGCMVHFDVCDDEREAAQAVRRRSRARSSGSSRWSCRKRSSAPASWAICARTPSIRRRRSGRPTCRRASP